MAWTRASRRLAIVAAHPDDETIGAGGHFSLLQAPIFIHVTDGAPRNMADAAVNGFDTREAYAQQRRSEFLEALRVAGVQPAEAVSLGYVDQEASLHLAGVISDLRRLLERLSIQMVLTHPYEGGHPDHDATAFAVHAACRTLPPGRRPQIVEFTSYHGRGGEIETGVFLPNGDSPEVTVPLGPEALARKHEMLRCFRTQQPVLSHFTSATEERFRPAPFYDFTRPPHPGPLFYEQFPWGMTSARFLALASEAVPNP